MTKKPFAVIHDLSKLNDSEVVAYLAAVSEFIGLPPELNGLDTIWMVNENGPGQSKVVYARRGTAEILRNRLGIKIESLVHAQVNGSIMFTATGIDNNGRQEIATGSKFISGLTGKALDDAIMTASTRALRRVTMQFTSLGILDESEVTAVVGQEVNPAGSARLAGSPMVLPTVEPNNAPGAIVGEIVAQIHDEAIVEVPAPATLPESVTSAVVPPPTIEGRPVIKKKARRNTVSLEVETETAVAEPVVLPARGLVEALPKPPSEVPPPAVPVFTTVNAGEPSKEQMADYHKRVRRVTDELSAGVGVTPGQRMRAFITKQSGTAPHNMNTNQWDTFLTWMEKRIAEGGVAGVIADIQKSETA
jgi:hypothetical protein